ncbi:hypothetical protein C1646_685795 [Rhizophagus diaphanus]|nr:hypothetical protein C1646_685795 [Rhizophagus diaphanus] [Rhizophagus sp. MUCL 43196]
MRKFLFFFYLILFPSSFALPFPLSPSFSSFLSLSSLSPYLLLTSPFLILFSLHFFPLFSLNLPSLTLSHPFLFPLIDVVTPQR